VGSGTIGQLDDGLARIAREYPAAPPAPLIHRAAAIGGQIQAMLGGHQRLEQTRDLYLIGAKACAFLAWALSDLGHQRAAAAHGRTALILADEAGHPGARASRSLRSRRSLFSMGHCGWRPNLPAVGSSAARLTAHASCSRARKPTRRLSPPPCPPSSGLTALMKRSPLRTT
jgi:hypothetical protein